jgi:hypothetical protein
MNQDALEKSVGRGIALLDLHSPNWAHGLSASGPWSDLNMKSCHRCILGRLFGTYLKGINSMGFSSASALKPEYYGFTLAPLPHKPSETAPRHPPEHWRMLKTAWLKMLAARVRKNSRNIMSSV